MFLRDATAAAGVESRAMQWDVDPALWQKRACAIVGRA